MKGLNKRSNLKKNASYLFTHVSYLEKTYTTTAQEPSIYDEPQLEPFYTVPALAWNVIEIGEQTRRQSIELTRYCTFQIVALCCKFIVNCE